MNSLGRGILILILVAAASGTGYYFGTQRASPVISGHEEDLVKFRELKAKLDQIGQIDIEEYLKLRDQKERYEKSEEILAKILQIMLVDMGLRMSERQLNQLKTTSKTTPSPPSTNTAATTSEGSSRPSPAPRAEATPQVPEWKKESARAKEVVTESQIADFLKKVEIPDLFSELRIAKSLNQENFDLLNGRYLGQAVFDDPTQQAPWDVEMIVSGRVENQKYRGRHRILLSRYGKQFSNLRGSIDADDYSQIDGDSSGIVVEIGGDIGYFVLYFFPRLGEFHGNVYLKEGLGNYKRRGTLRLNRR